MHGGSHGEALRRHCPNGSVAEKRIEKQRINLSRNRGDIAVVMESRKKLKNMRWMMILTGIPVTALQWFSIIFWIIRGIWWPFVVWVLVAAVWGTLVSWYYFNHVKYICPECHEVFKPTFKEAFWANHPPATRKLTCTHCSHKGFCVEIWGGDGK